MNKDLFAEEGLKYVIKGMKGHPYSCHEVVTGQAGTVLLIMTFSNEENMKFLVLLPGE